ncbi:MAG: fatty-acyl-CoA synthase [Idiomarinaceae bacterium HL-53]|nr:MAG: fatty-acyl-CoA synthase [Idiomarinaceae bacterium HL-53]CUS49172.1 citronellyl-CoA synthetase [Idiomarinaceae bacterium HL-53]
MRGSNNNIAKAFGWTEFLLAFMRFLPRLPRFLRANIRLLSARKHHTGSTGLLLQRYAKRQPQAQFLRFESQVHTYGEFNARVNQLARRLQSAGIGRGEVVAVMFENSPEQLASVFAINKLGAIAALMNYKQRGEVLHHSLVTVQPKAVIVSELCEDNFLSADALNETPDTYLKFWMPEDAWNQLQKRAPSEFSSIVAESVAYSAENLEITEQVKLGETCFYVMTSGTTGLPKAAAMTHLRWFKAGIAFGRMALGIRAKDIQYCCLPFYHNTALSIALSSTLITGATLAIGRKFSATHFWQEIHQHQATCFTYIGELCRYLLNQPMSALEKSHAVRAVIGNGMRTEVWDEFQQRFKISRICELYGASEGNIGFVNVFNLKRTVGFSPLKFAVVRFDAEHEEPIVDRHGRLQKVKKGEVGLLLAEVNAKAPFDGYTNNAAANEAKLIRNAFRQNDCWFNTGDLVRAQGFRHIAFIDRVGDTFRWKSENVATTEVEAYVQKVQGIVEAVVYGVKVPNTEGRAGMVSIVVESASHFNPKRFYQQIKETLPDYAVPLFVRLCGQHEKTGTHKVVKTHLKRQGFTPSAEADALFVLIDRQRGYEPLNHEILQQIEQGQIRF